MSTMNALIIFLLCVRFDLSSPLPAGGNSYLDCFYCEPAGCAAKVSKVFCEDELVFENGDIADCRGLPSKHSVCQYDGRAFVSAPKGNRCEFEKENTYINTTKCTEGDDICSSLTPSPLTTSPTNATDVEKKPDWTPATYILAGICGIVCVALIWYFCRRRTQGANQPANPTRNHDEMMFLQANQTSGDINESSTRGDEEPDGNTSPHRGHGH